MDKLVTKEKTMNNQEIFDKVVLHARTQKVKALQEDQCKYRTEDGLKCFIGALIPDDKYDPLFEGLIPLFKIIDYNTDHCKRVIRFNNTMIEIGFDFTQHDFISKLQAIHDCHPIEEWERKFQSFAEKYELTYNPPSTANQ